MWNIAYNWIRLSQNRYPGSYRYHDLYTYRRELKTDVVYDKKDRVCKFYKNDL